MDNVVNCNKTYLLQNGRSSVFFPCINNFSIKEQSQSLSLGEGVSVRLKMTIRLVCLLKTENF